MTRSMRARLFVILMVTTGLVWLSAVLWIFYSTRAQFEQVLDARLMEAANMVSSLLVEQDVDASRVANISKSHPDRSAYERQLSCQIWSFEGNLISKSDGAPNGALTTRPAGFSQTTVDGETWRVYAVENKALGVRVLVGDNLHIRDQLVGDVIKGLLLPALLIMPLLAGLIWLSLRSGLAPLQRVAAHLRLRSASDFTPVPEESSTSEIVPMIAALNGLFGKVADARERERNFTAFAAHELRTPLAGLKTQAQIALASNDPAIRERALEQIVQGVNRTGRLVRQLLDLVSIEANGADRSSGAVNPGEALFHLREELVPHCSRPVEVSIADDLFEFELAVDADLFTLVARNLLENALLHAGPDGHVECRLASNGGVISIAIEDSGPGIPEDELSHVTERFFRGRNKTPIGSGLGLSIAELALNQAGATLHLSNREEGGLSARIVVSSQAISARSVNRRDGRWNPEAGVPGAGKKQTIVSEQTG